MGGEINIVSLGLTLVGPRDCCTGEGRPKGRTVSKNGDLWSPFSDPWRGSAVKGTWVFPEPRCQGPRTTPYTLLPFLRLLLTGKEETLCN